MNTSAYHVDRCFEARGEATVAIHGWVREREQRLAVLDDAANEMESHLGQPGMVVTSEEVEPVLLVEAEVAVHARACSE
jgi:hypothetical protein